MNITEQKQALRKLIKERKQTLSAEEKIRLSDSIFEQVEVLPQFAAAHTILVYWAMADEVQTQNFILRWQHSKRFVLPVVVGNDLELREFGGVDQLQQGTSFNLLEPHAGALVAPQDIELVIVPGIAFDRAGNRLGRGKAYYDKLLSASNVYKVAVCFAIQLVDQVPVEPTDICMDKVIWA